MNTLILSSLLILNIMTAETFTPKELAYEYNALAPHISEETMNYHHGKHYKAYVTNLNKLVEGTDFTTKSLEEVVCSSEGGMFNNAAQALNHEFYFEALSPTPQKAPLGKLAEAINRDFGSVELLIEQLSSAAKTHFGSGWAWLVVDKDGKLAIVTTCNAETPLTAGLKPLLCIDVWEHAYYIDYRNSRPNAVDAIWNVIDWKMVESRY